MISWILQILMVFITQVWPYSLVIAFQQSFSRSYIYSSLTLAANHLTLPWAILVIIHYLNFTFLFCRLTFFALNSLPAHANPQFSRQIHYPSAPREERCLLLESLGESVSKIAELFWSPNMAPGSEIPEWMNVLPLVKRITIKYYKNYACMYVSF